MGKKIQTEDDYESLIVEDLIERMPTVASCIKMIKKELPGDIPLIGFAGSPWTVFCYMIQGSGSKDFSEAKSFAYNFPALSLKITLMEITIIIMMIIITHIPFCLPRLIWRGIYFTKIIF